MYFPGRVSYAFEKTHWLGLENIHPDYFPSNKHKGCICLFWEQNLRLSIACFLQSTEVNISIFKLEKYHKAESLPENANLSIKKSVWWREAERWSHRNRLPSAEGESSFGRYLNWTLCGVFVCACAGIFVCVCSYTHTCIDTHTHYLCTYVSILTNRKVRRCH